MAEKQQLYLLPAGGRWPEKVWGSRAPGLGLGSLVRLRGDVYRVDHFASFGAYGVDRVQGASLQAVYMRGPIDAGDLHEWESLDDAFEAEAPGKSRAGSRTEPEPEWEGQRFFVRWRGPGDRREELVRFRNTEATLPYRPGQALVLVGLC